MIHLTCRQQQVQTKRIQKICLSRGIKFLFTETYTYSVTCYRSPEASAQSNDVDGAHIFNLLVAGAITQLERLL